MDFPHRSPVVVTLLAVLSWHTGLGTYWYVPLSQELWEHAFMLGIVYPVVSHPFCYLLVTVMDFPPAFWASSRLSCQNHVRVALVLAGACTQVRSQLNRSLCLVLALQWYLTCSAIVSGQIWSSPLYFLAVFMFVMPEPRDAGLGTSRYVYLSQELAEQVLMLAINLPVVTNLFCYCLRSDLEFPPLLFGCLHVCHGGTRG